MCVKFGKISEVASKQNCHPLVSSTYNFLLNSQLLDAKYNHTIGISKHYVHLPKKEKVGGKKHYYKHMLGVKACMGGFKVYFQLHVTMQC